MGNIPTKSAQLSEAIRRIKEAKSKGSDLLILSGIGLTSEDLKLLIPRIRKMRKLKKLALGNNKIRILPKEIGTLKQLTNLILFKNLLIELPEDVKTLKNLQVLDLTDNPLKKEEIIRLTAIFKGNVLRTNMAAYQRTQDPKKVLEAIYGEPRAAEMAIELNALELGFFQIEGGDFKSAPEIFQEFLEKFPETDEYSEKIYFPAARHLLDNALNTHLPEEERGLFVQQIATSLNDCPTPVKSFLVQAYIGQFLEKQEEIPDYLYTFIEREAIEEHILSQLAEDILRDNELIEQVQGLSNSLYLADAENREDNKVPITGDRDRLPTKTDNLEISFGLISEEAALAFVQLVCKTNDKQEAIKKDGKYEFDLAKVRAIAKPYFSSRHILPLAKKYAQQFSEEMQVFIPAKKNAPEHTEVRLTAAKLQLQLEGLKNSEMAAFYQNFVAAQKTVFKKVSRDDSLTALTTALNEDHRLQGGEVFGTEVKTERKTSVQKQSM
ncbi:hypothetical protein [Ascidiimonas sp. W6]|uniref:leucine-rich repeat domain-containing protein n=1 Tax=Ascidiimonas meishanensis TaxID=3128903 RepID=UPI0030EC65DC